MAGGGCGSIGQRRRRATLVVREARGLTGPGAEARRVRPDDSEEPSTLNHHHRNSSQKAVVISAMPPSSSSKPTTKASSASLISTLQRAQFGIATLSGSSDKEIADLLAAEAKKKEKIWQEYGLGAAYGAGSTSTSTRSSCVAFSLVFSRRVCPAGALTCSFYLIQDPALPQAAI